MPNIEPELNERQRTQFRGLIEEIVTHLKAQRDALDAKIIALEEVGRLYGTGADDTDGAAPKTEAKKSAKRNPRRSPATRTPRTKSHAPPRTHRTHRAPENPDGKLLSVAQVAGRVGTHITTIYAEIKTGRLKPVNEQRPAMFTQEEFARWFAARTNKSAAP